MLRLSQYSQRISRGMHIRASAASFTRNDALLSWSGPQQERTTLSPPDNNAANSLSVELQQPTSFGLSSSSNNSSTTSTRGMTIASSARSPSALFSTATSRRFMSTGAAPGNISTGSEAGREGVSVAADVALNAAGSADQAQAVIEAAPLTFKMLLSIPPQLAISVIDGLHVASGLPYWLAIVAITVGLRTAVLPIVVMSMKNDAKFAAMMPEMDLLEKTRKKDPQSAQVKKAERYRQETRALYKKHDYTLWIKGLSVVQFPLFVGLLFGLRKMPEMVPEIATGGAFWFQNLGAADPYMIFPVTVALSGVLMGELANIQPNAMAKPSTVRAGIRVMSLLSIPLTMNFPVTILVYITTSNACSILQTLAAKSSSLEKLLKLPKPPKAPEVPETELGWMDVVGGVNPFKAYKKRKQEQEAQTWFGHQVVAPGAGGPVVRKGAPLPPPPAMAPSERKMASRQPSVSVSPAFGQQPKVVTYAVRPKRVQGNKKGN